MLNEEILKMEDKYNISGVLGSDHSLLSASMFIAYYFGKITDLIVIKMDFFIKCRNSCI